MSATGPGAIAEMKGADAGEHIHFLVVRVRVRIRLIY